VSVEKSECIFVRLRLFAHCSLDKDVISGKAKDTGLSYPVKNIWAGADASICCGGVIPEVVRHCCNCFMGGIDFSADMFFGYLHIVCCLEKPAKSPQKKTPRTQIYMDLSYINPQTRVLNYCFK